MARLFTNQIADYLMSLIQASVAGLKTVAKGDLSQLPAPEKLSDLAPGVIVEPGKVRLSDVNTGHSLEVTYPFTVYYFRRYAENEEITEKAVEEAQAIVELILSNFELPGLAIPELQRRTGFAKYADFAAGEDRVLRGLKIPVSLVPIEVEIQTRVSWR